MIRNWYNRYAVDKSFRRVVFLVAVVLTLGNWMLISMLQESGSSAMNDGLFVLMIAVMAVLNLVTYYVAGGIGGCLALLKWPTRICEAIIAIIASFTLFLGPLVWLFCWVVGAYMALVLAFSLPVVGVPLAGVLSGRIVKAYAPEAAAEASYSEVDGSGEGSEAGGEA